MLIEWRSWTTFRMHSEVTWMNDVFKSDRTRISNAYFKRTLEILFCWWPALCPIFHVCQSCQSCHKHGSRLCFIFCYRIQPSDNLSATPMIQHWFWFSPWKVPWVFHATIRFWLSKWISKNCFLRNIRDRNYLVLFASEAIKGSNGLRKK